MKNKLKELNTELTKERYANLRTTVLCTIDDLNQYLNGNISDSAIIEALEIFKKVMKK
tara:strand:+ start:386 stop:559 length:174 start_codon:yes stop_codon:yes gene_type:complete